MPTQIGERIVARRATITGLVGTLVRRGYAARARDPHDRRRVLVSITPSEYRHFAGQLGLSDVTVVPISALRGDTW